MKCGVLATTRAQTHETSLASSIGIPVESDGDTRNPRVPVPADTLSPLVRLKAELPACASAETSIWTVTAND